MEYAGAAMSGWFAVGHELQHNYFARAVMPANGNAGWIDEAVASWRDYRVLHKLFHWGNDMPNFTLMNLGNHSVYNRKTDKRSYEKGRIFMFYLDSVLKEVNGKSLKGFLKKYFDKRKYTTISTLDFQLDLEAYYGRSLNVIFNKYIYGIELDHDGHNMDENPYHLQLSDHELKEII